MMNYGYGPGVGYALIPFGFIFPLFILISIWILYWKGKALWRAARKGQFEWFIALLLINTLGILEIVYLYYFSKEEIDEAKEDVDTEKSEE